MYIALLKVITCRKVVLLFKSCMVLTLDKLKFDSTILGQGILNEGAILLDYPTVLGRRGEADV